MASLPAEPIVRWCALCSILLGKNFIHTATEFLHDLHLDGKTIKTSLRALSLADQNIDLTNRIEIKRLLAQNCTDVTRCVAAISDITSGGNMLFRVDEVITSGECTSVGELAVTGRDLIELGFPPGRELGEILNKLLDFVIENPKSNNSETLLSLVESWKI